MNLDDPGPRFRESSADEEAIDALIRRRFRACQTLPLFPASSPPLPPGFFQPPDIGRQLPLLPDRLRADRR